MQRFESFAPTDGHLPRTADEIAIPKGTADTNDFKVGDKIQIAGRGAQEAYTIVGHRHRSPASTPSAAA